jgi:hypothetical protein
VTTGDQLMWGRTRAAWEAAVEAEVLRSTGEQGLPVEVDDLAALNRIACVLADGMIGVDRSRRSA